jgi:hypothetical protein
MLLPDPSVQWGIPCDAETLSDNPGARDRMRSIMDRHTQAISDSVTELADLGLIKEAWTEIKVHGSPLAFKVYIINELEVFFGFYPVAKHTVRIKGQQADIYDLVGKDAMLFHHAADDGPDSIDFQYVEQTRAWFDSMWTTVAHELAD